MTRRPLDAEIARARREAERAAAVAGAAHAKLAALVRAQADLFDAVSGGLQSTKDRSNIGINMQAQTEGKPRRIRISAGRSTIDSESRSAAVAADLTDGDIARLTGASRSAVQKWQTGLMAIPRRHAEKLVKHGIPLASWKRLGD